jgi:V/A-type H+-transporting ATPase subunit A
MNALEPWYQNVGADWQKLREEAMSLLKEEEELREVVSLVGAEILGDKQRCVFEAVKMLKEYFLLQSAFHPVDMYCPISKTYKMLHLILKFYQKARQAAISGIPLAKVLSLSVKEDLARMKIVTPEEFDEVSSKISEEINQEFEQLSKQATGGEST